MQCVPVGHPLDQAGWDQLAQSGSKTAWLIFFLFFFQKLPPLEPSWYSLALVLALCAFTLSFLYTKDSIYVKPIPHAHVGMLCGFTFRILRLLHPFPAHTPTCFASSIPRCTRGKTQCRHALAILVWVDTLHLLACQVMFTTSYLGL